MVNIIFTNIVIVANNIIIIIIVSIVISIAFTIRQCAA